MSNPNKETIVSMTGHVLAEQSKFIYYMIALAVTAIGYSVHISLNLQFVWMQIPMALAVMSWGLSVLYGLSYLSDTNALAKQNIRYLEMKGSRTTLEVGNEEQELSDKIMVSITEVIKFYNRNKGWFYFGLIMFLLWWVLKIYSNTYILPITLA